MLCGGVVWDGVCCGCCEMFCGDTGVMLYFYVVCDIGFLMVSQFFSIILNNDQSLISNKK